LCVEHFARRTKLITLLNQVVDLLSSLQNAFDGLVQDNLGLVQLLLDLHNTVCLLWVLVLDNVVLQLGVGHVGRIGRVGESRFWVFGEELIADFGEELMGYKGGVFVVGDDEAADAF
jgi:hypothetical protein